MVECAVGCICACLPTLKPLFVHPDAQSRREASTSYAIRKRTEFRTTIALDSNLTSRNRYRVTAVGGAIEDDDDTKPITHAAGGNFTGEEVL